MSKPAAFQATVHGFRTIPSRSVVSITIEAPIEHHAEIARIAVHGAWVAVARLEEPKADKQPSAPKDKKNWRDMPKSQQCAIRCGEPIFWAFLKEQHSDIIEFAPTNTDECAQVVRSMCAIDSRKELDRDHAAGMFWFNLDQSFAAWKALEHA